MIREYSLVTPSLNGLIHHECIEYEGIVRPPEITQIFDRPRRSGYDKEDAKIVFKESIENRKVIESYFHDLYSVFMKKLAEYALKDDITKDESVKLLAMLQEFIRIKELLAGIEQIT